MNSRIATFIKGLKEKRFVRNMSRVKVTCIVSIV